MRGKVTFLTSSVARKGKNESEVEWLITVTHPLVLSLLQKTKSFTRSLCILLWGMTFASTLYRWLINARSPGERERLCGLAVATVLYLFTILDQGGRKINDFKHLRFFLIETELNRIELLLKYMKYNSLWTYAISMCVETITRYNDRTRLYDSYRF